MILRRIPQMFELSSNLTQFPTIVIQKNNIKFGLPDSKLAEIDMQQCCLRRIPQIFAPSSNFTHLSIGVIKKIILNSVFPTQN